LQLQDYLCAAAAAAASPLPLLPPLSLIAKPNIPPPQRPRPPQKIRIIIALNIEDVYVSCDTK